MSDYEEKKKRLEEERQRLRALAMDLAFTRTRALLEGRGK